MLGDNQAKELEPKDYKTLLGKYIKVGDISFKVVGIYKSRGEGNGRAYSSYTAIKSIYGADTPSLGSIEFTFKGLTSEDANEALRRTIVAD